MKKSEITKILKKKSKQIAAVALAAVIAAGGGIYRYESQKYIPELVTFVDSEGTIEIAEEDTPLSAPKVTKTVKTTKKTKKIKLKKKSKKTYNVAGGTTTTKNTSTSQNGNTTTTTETVVDTSVMNSFKKGSKVEKQTTTTTTTITKTEMTTASGESTSSSTVVSTTAKNSNGSTNVKSLASKADSRVLNAFTRLGFKVNVTSNASYTGLFDARKQLITLRRTDDTIYHELGHFVGFITGNTDRTAAFKAVYEAEKNQYTHYNKVYVTSSSSEYFAESFKNYTLNPGELKANRPQTYAAIDAAVNRITEAQVERVASVYGSVWNL